MLGVEQLVKLVTGGRDVGDALKALGVDPKQMQDKEEIEAAVIALACVASSQGATVYTITGTLKGRAFRAVVAIEEPPKLSS